MTYVHHVVVNNISQVVGGEAVVLQNDLVVNVFVVEDYLTMDDVFESGLALGHLHADNVGLAVGLLFFDLILGQTIVAKSIVLGLCVLLATDLNSHLLQPFCRAEARISIAIFDQSVHELVVDCEALTLIVWAVGSLRPNTQGLACILSLIYAAWSLIPGQTRPL